MSNLRASIWTVFTLIVLMALTFHEYLDIPKTLGCSSERP